jgi:hypothetical protein
MPYITSDAVKAKRAEIIAALPRKEGWKVSVTRDHGSTIRIVLLEGPVPLTAAANGYEQVNPYHAEEWAPSAKAAAILRKVLKIAFAGNRTLYEDSDYGNIPAFYVNLNVGKWDLPYKVVTV